MTWPIAGSITAAVGTSDGYLNLYDDAATWHSYHFTNLVLNSGGGLLTGVPREICSVYWDHWGGSSWIIDGWSIGICANNGNFYSPATYGSSGDIGRNGMKGELVWIKLGGIWRFWICEADNSRSWRVINTS